MNIINRKTTIINFNANFLETHKMNNDDLSKKEILLFVWANIFHNIIFYFFFEEYKIFKKKILTQILMIYEKIPYVSKKY